jgi:hypothetical protein
LQETPAATTIAKIANRKNAACAGDAAARPALDIFIK